MPKKTKAVALKYNIEQDLAPVVIASGYGEVAERIINIAEERGIPVYRDDSAASMLCMLEVGASIPEELYQVVATIYIQIMETANRIKEGAADKQPPGAGVIARRPGRAAVAMEAAVPEMDPAQAEGDDGFTENFVERAMEASRAAPGPAEPAKRLTAEQIAEQIRKQLAEGIVP